MATFTGAAGTNGWFDVHHSDQGQPDDTTTNNWDTDPGFPGPGDTADLGSHTVTLTGIPFGDSDEIGSLSIGAGGSLTGNGNVGIQVDGDLNVAGALTDFILVVGATDVSWSGGGTITLHSPDNGTAGLGVAGGLGPVTIVNHDVLNGSFSIATGGTFVNDGEVDANVDSGGIEFGWGAGYQIENGGQMTASGQNATLTFNVLDHGGNIGNPITIANTGGTIAANGAGSVVDFNGNALFSTVTVTGGTIVAGGSGAEIDLSGTTIAGATIGTPGIGAKVEMLSSSVFDGAQAPVTFTGALADSGNPNNGIDLTLEGTVEFTFGTIDFNSSQFGNRLVIDGPAVTFDSGVSVSADLIGATDATTDVLQNAGTIGGNHVIEDLTVDNSGSIAALGGAVLALEASADVVNTSAGTLLASGAGSVVELLGGTVSGGTLETFDGGTIAVEDGTTLDGTAAPVTVDGTLEIAFPATLNLKGTVDFGTGLTIDLSGPPGGGVVNFAGDGTAVLNNDGTIWGIDSITDLTLDNQANGTIEANGVGDGTVIHTGHTVTNAGIIEAAGGAMTVEDAIVNNAILAAGGGATLEIDGKITGSGEISIFGDGTADLQAAVGAHQEVRFLGGGTLQVSDLFRGTISHFGAGDAIAGILADATLSYHGNAAHTAGTLTLQDSGGDTKTLHFAGRYAASEFALDTNGDLVVTPTVNYAHAAGGVGVDLAHQEADAAAAGAAVPSTAKAIDAAATDFFSGVTGAVGSAHGDVLLGSAVANALSGGAGNDTVAGGAGNDHLWGGSGNDTLNGGAGNDHMAGGAGNDTYVVDSAGDTVTESAGKAGGIDLVESSVSYTLGANVENLTLVGRAAIDGTGNGLGNIITGNRAANHLVGGAGNDVLDGGAGSDTLTGGAGHDIFLFDSRLAATNVDHITDFAHRPDTIELAHADFAALAAGHLAADAFVADATGAATTADQRIIYDTVTGALSYDSDGNGSHAAVQFAIVDNHAHAAVTAADFLVV